jgi:hypothetical protein
VLRDKKIKKRVLSLIIPLLLSIPSGVSVSSVAFLLLIISIIKRKIIRVQSTFGWIVLSRMA